MTGEEKFQPLFFEPKEVDGKIEMVRVKPNIDFSMRKGDNWGEDEEYYNAQLRSFFSFTISILCFPTV